jgi:hypothetical protein
MDFNQWNNAISRDVTAFNDTSPKEINRLLEAYEDELNEEEDVSALESKTKMNPFHFSSHLSGK